MKRPKVTTNELNVVQLVSRESAVAEFGESAASTISHDAMVNWMKFILTDDMPNKNGERVPASEFDNLIKTGFYKPVKMMVGDINDGHEDAEPIGVITHLTKEGNKIVALAALWPSERGDDVQLLKDRIEAGKPVNVSWEIFYGDRVVEASVASLKDTTLRAVTIVGLPAYAGRTPVLAIASNKWSESYIQSLPDSAFLHITDDGRRLFPFRDLEGKISAPRFDELDQEISESELDSEVKQSIASRWNKLKLAISSDQDIIDLLVSGKILEVDLNTTEIEAKVAELEAQVLLLNEKLNEKEQALASTTDAKTQAETEATSLKEKLASLEVEVVELRELKQQIDDEQAKATKLQALKEKFNASGVEKPEEFFSENFEKLSAMDEAGLDFMLQELVAFSKEENTSSASTRSSVPNVPGATQALSISDLAKALRERNK